MEYFENRIPSISKEEFSRLVNQTITELGISENAFCDCFEVSIPTVKRYRNAEIMPTPNMAARMVAEMQRLIESHRISSGLGSTALKES